MSENKTHVLIAIIALVLGAIIGYSFKFKISNEYMPAHDMSSESQMRSMSANLEGKSGDEFDMAFINEMIVHHEGAVEMAKKVLATSKRSELIKLANDIIAVQTKEINMMKSWRDAWFKTSAPGTPDNTGAVACTMEAKMCPDGSFVGRQGPNCEFAACPGN